MRNYPVGIQAAALVVAWVAMNGGSIGAGPGGTVTGHGIVELKRQPECLRVQVDLLARGKDVNEALGKLRERRHAAQKHLEQLGLAANSVEFGKPMIVEEKNDRQQRQMAMMMRQMNQGKKPAQKPKEPPPIIVSCTLKAELRLKPADSEELLILAHALEEGIKLADLGGLKDLKHASPQDDEQEQEEAAEMMAGNSDAPKRGEPIFSYVSKVSEEEQMKVRAEAFQKAQREAGRLAKAAGVDLGTLYHLEDNSVSTNPWEDSANYMDSSYAYRVQQILAMRASGANADKMSSEAIGLSPTAVSYRVTLSASFELKKPAGK